jgi:hypothetical protein
MKLLKRSGALMEISPSFACAKAGVETTSNDPIVKETVTKEPKTRDPEKLNLQRNISIEASSLTWDFIEEDFIIEMIDDLEGLG